MSNTNIEIVIYRNNKVIKKYDKYRRGGLVVNIDKESQIRL